MNNPKGVVPAPPPWAMDWLWYKPDSYQFPMANYCRITCYDCRVSFNIERTKVRINCFACGKFLKRPYSI